MTPTQDELSLAEAVGRLTEENKNLAEQVRQLTYGHRVDRALAWGKAIAFALPIACALSFVAGYPAWKGITASGQVEHCYVTFVMGEYRLKGNVTWREDPSFGDFTSVEEAKAMAAKLDCKMGPLQ